jgi:hypothetical protein
MGAEPSTFSWWTDVAVPLGAALIGGAAALLGAWRGAKWAAKEQQKGAGLIAAELRRDQLQSDALLQLDRVLTRLEVLLDRYSDTWDSSPNQMDGNWGRTLQELLVEFEAELTAVIGRIRDPHIRETLEAVPAYQADEVEAAQQTRDTNQDQASIDAAREVNGRLLEDIRELREDLHERL